MEDIRIGRGSSATPYSLEATAGMAGIIQKVCPPNPNRIGLYISSVNVSPLIFVNPANDNKYLVWQATSFDNTKFFNLENLGNMLWESFWWLPLVAGGTVTFWDISLEKQ